MKILSKERKNFLFVLAVFCAAVFLFFLTQQSKLTEAAWWNESWAYRQTVAITNAGTAQTNFQIAITLNTSALITAGKMQSNCNDIRITDINGKILPHWIEENNPGCNQTTTKIWTKVSSIGTTGNTIYLYYGNPSASNVENPNQVFVFYDNFSSDLSRWTNPSGCAGAISSGVLQISTSTGCDSTPMYVTSLNLSDTSGYALDFRGKFSSGGSGRLQTYQRYRSTNSHLARYWILGTVTYYQEANPGFGSNTDIGTSNMSADTWYNLSAKVAGSNNTWTVNGTSIGSNTTLAATLLTQTDLTVGLGQYTTTVQYDNVRVRKSASTEPSIAAPTNEEKSAGPVAYWKFDEGYGTSSKDSTSSNQTLSFTGTPTWTTDDQCISGKCINFDTDNSDYASNTVSSTSPLNLGTSDFTINMWQKVFQPTTFGSGLIGRYPHNSSYNGNFSTGIADDLTTYFFYHRDMSGVLQSFQINYSSYFGKWVNVTWIKSGSTMSLYIDGKFKQSWNITITFNINFSGVPFYLSQTGWSPGVMNNLMMDDIKIYNYARTAAQVKADFASKGSGSVKGISASMGSSSKNSDAFSNGLVGYWKMDEASWNGTANEVIDSSGNNNYMVAKGTTGTATITSGEYGNGGNFTRTNGHLVCTNGGSGTSCVDNNNVDITGDITISMWLKAPATSSTVQVPLAKYSGCGYEIVTGTTGLVNIGGRAGGCGTYGSSGSSTTSVYDNNWHLVTSTRQNNTLNIYVDGKLENSNTTSTNGGDYGNSGSLIIGAENSSGGNAYDGKVDDVRIYNRSLSPKEVRDLYNWAPGPVAYYNFDEKSGTNAYDLSGNNQTGTINGNPTWIPSKSTGSALNFDGTGDYVSYTLPSTSPLKISGALTLGFWMNTTTGTSDAGLVGTGIASGYQCTHHNGATLYCYISSGGNAVTTSLGTGTWKYISFTWDGTTGINGMKIYVNGVLTAQNTSSIAAASGWTTLQIGNSSTNYNGKLDEVKVYNYARTPKQIVEDMNAGHPAGGSPVGSQVGYWKFDEGYGTTVNNTISGQPNFTFASSPNDPSFDNNGKFAKAIYFDGALSVTTEDYADATFTAQTWDDGTLSVWIKPDSIPASEYYPISDYNGVVGESGGWLVAISSNGGCSIRGNASYNSSCPANTFAASQWTQLTWVVSKTQGFVKTYANGKLINTVSSNTLGFRINTTLRVGMGSWCGTGSDCIYPGFLDEVKIYNSALTEDEVKLDYNRGSAMVLGDSIENRDRVTSGQTLYLDATNKNSYSGTGTNWYDLSGNNYNATLSSPTWNGLKFNNTAATLTGLGSSVYSNIAANTTILWVYPETGSGLDWSITDSDGNTYMSYSGDSNAYINTWETGGYTQRTIWNVTESVPHQIVITKNGSVRTVYDNLVQKGQVTITNIATSVNTNLVFGNASRPMGLSIVEAYNRVLSTDEITQDYYAHAYKFSLNAEPVGEWKMDEKTGTSANDTSGNGNTGIITGATWTTGKVGAGLSLNGSSDYITITNNSVLQPTTALTISEWVKINAFNDSWQVSNQKAVYDINYGYHMREDNPSNTFLFSVGHGSTSTQIGTATTFSTGVWYYVTGVFDGSTVKIYVNGKLDNSTAANGSTINYTGVSSSMYIGQRSDNNLRTNGYIDQVRIFNYARTSAQVAYDYNRGAPVGWWKMDECQGGTANDSSGNGNGGTITIGATGSQTAVGTCTTSGTAWFNGVTGKFNSSLNFDGTDDYVNVLDNSILRMGTSDWTTSAWIKTSQSSGTYQIIDKRSSGPTVRYQMTVANGKLFAELRSTSAPDVSASITGTKNVADGTWHHVVATFTRASNLVIYVDAVSDGSVSISSMNGVNINGSSEFKIGAVALNNSLPFNGQIDDVRVYNYALTTQQVKTLYNENSSIRFGPSSGSP